MNKFIFYLAPVLHFGEGSYAISAVKEIKVTEEYIQLDKNILKCQNKETFENCTTREYLQMVKNHCNCVPYALKNLLKTKMVTILIERIRSPII